MIALDTNVLVRYVVGDDPVQLEIATEFIERELKMNRPGFISLVVMAEFVWVLGQSYKLPRQTIQSSVRGLLESPVIVVENSMAVEEALAHGRADFTDALIQELGRQAGCERTVTFDRGFARSPGVDLLGK